MKNTMFEFSDNEIALLRKSLDEPIDLEQIKQILTQNIQIIPENQSSDVLDMETLEEIFVNKDYRKFISFMEKLTYFSNIDNENVCVNNFLTISVNSDVNICKSKEILNNKLESNKENFGISNLDKEIRVKFNEFYHKNLGKIEEIITSFKSDILKKQEFSKLNKLEIELLYKVTDIDNFIELISKSVLNQIHNKLNIKVFYENIDSLSSFKLHDYNLDLILESFIKLSDLIIESFTDKLKFDSMKISVIENIFINTILEIYVKIITFKHRYNDLSLKENTQFPNKMFVLRASKDGVDFLRNFSKMLEIFMIYFGKELDYKGFFSKITKKYDLFLNKFFDEFNTVLIKENHLISESYLVKTVDESLENFPINIDHLFQKEFKDILKSRKVSLGLSNTLNDSKFIDFNQIELLYKKKYKVEIISRKKGEQDMIYLALFSDYFNFLQKLLQDIDNLKFFNEFLLILILENVVIFIENVLNNVLLTIKKPTKLFYLNESLEETLTFYTSFVYFQVLLEKTVLKLNSKRIFHLTLQSRNVIHFRSVEEIFTRIKEISVKFREDFDSLLLSNIQRYINTFVIRSLLQNDWKSPKNEPSSLQQFLVSKDSKNKDLILKNKSLTLVPSYGLISFSIYFFELCFQRLKMLYESIDAYEFTIDLINKAVSKIALFYLRINPAKEKIKYVINDLLFLLDKAIILNGEMLWKLISFSLKKGLNKSIEFKQSLYTILYKIHFSIGFIELFLFEVISNEKDTQYEVITNKILFLIEKSSFLYCNRFNFNEYEKEDDTDKSLEDLDEIIKRISHSLDHYASKNNPEIKQDLFGIFYSNYCKIIDDLIYSKGNYEEYEKNYLIIYRIMTLIFSSEDITTKANFNLIDIITKYNSNDQEDIKTPNYLKQLRPKIKQFIITSLYLNDVDKSDFLNEEYQIYIHMKLLINN